MASPSASDVAQTFAVTPDVYVVGSLSNGVTIYQQQARALNLAWALTELHRNGDRSLGDVVVIGGGVAGLTFAAALASVADAPVTLLEQRWDLCPLQQGSDTRWVHPFLYNWPEQGSRRPSASLPVLNWNAGRASDVAGSLLDKFGDRCIKLAALGQREPSVFLGLGHVRVNSSKAEVEWMGHSAIRDGRHFRAREPIGEHKRFDTIVLAAGFGLEADQPRTQSSIASGSYWRNDTLGQPVLTGARQVFVVSGHGDGGVVDLCRLTIERFRQDTILTELFGDEIELLKVEDELRMLVGRRGGRIDANVKQLLQSANPTLSAHLSRAQAKLRGRLRKDVRVVLHVRPTTGKPWSVDALFENKSSFLNRVLLYLLYGAGAFSIALEPLKSLVKRQNIPQTHVVQRHGTAAYDQVLGLFSDPAAVAPSLLSMKGADAQSPDMVWSTGFFPLDP